ncbi:uncharacterized protein V1518DRAFT_147047 [Limtongia smithiae]|uniref:uncharacterized protein n=1 Tax=Limtongia smithiae TaxID=1125753 RepID=UPI0034CFAD1F
MFLLLAIQAVPNVVRPRLHTQQPRTPLLLPPLAPTAVSIKKINAIDLIEDISEDDLVISDDVEVDDIEFDTTTTVSPDKFVIATSTPKHVTTACGFAPVFRGDENISSSNSSIAFDHDADDARVGTNQATNLSGGGKPVQNNNDLQQSLDESFSGAGMDGVGSSFSFDELLVSSGSGPVNKEEHVIESNSNDHEKDRASEAMTTSVSIHSSTRIAAPIAASRPSPTVKTGPYPYAKYTPVTTPLPTDDVQRELQALNQPDPSEAEHYYGEMTFEEWHRAGEELSERAAELIRKTIDVRRRKVQALASLESKIDAHAQGLLHTESLVLAEREKIRTKAISLLTEAGSSA